jgi:PAS domain S-box-containing protein
MAFPTNLAKALIPWMEATQALLVVTDPLGIVLAWNPAIARLTGISQEFILGQALLPVLKERGFPELAQVMGQVHSPGAMQAFEIKLPSPGNTSLEVVFEILMVSGTKGRSDLVMAVGRDLSELRALQNQVMHAGKLATVGQIAAGVAHEINNPLTSVQVCTEAVLRKASLAISGRGPNQFEPCDVDRLKKIQDGSERIRKVARDLVSYARPSTRDVESLHFNDVIEHALSFCEHVLAVAKATLVREMSPTIPPIRAVRDHLMQVVINLVSNAAYALRESGGFISIRTALLGNQVSLIVADTGEGIREEDRERVFEPFFTTKADGRGTGLGLSVVRNIVYSHGGKISFTSELGKGTTFVVNLPIGSATFVPQAEKQSR